jgi:hypothetical protein
MVLAPPQLANPIIQMPISMPFSYPSSSPRSYQPKPVTGKCPGCGIIIEPLKLGRYECSDCWAKRITPRYH